MSALLDLRVYRKAYAGRAVLSEVRLRLRPGEVHGLVGPRGSGKSTLLRIAAGLDRDFDGQVLVDGRSLQSPLSRDIGHLFQEPRLLPWLTVERNVGFGAERQFDAPRVAALLAEVGLSGQEQALPRQLSAALAQRVAIARALYARPRLLLLDDPFAALDPFQRRELLDLVIRLARRSGSGVLMATRDAGEAARQTAYALVLEAPQQAPHELPVL